MSCRSAFAYSARAWFCWALLASLLAPALTAQTVNRPSQPNDASKRDAILNSPDWQEVNRELDEWYSVQKIYDPDQVRELKRQMDARLAVMSGDELADFFIDLKQKLAILNGKEARDARKWLGETLSVAAPAYAKKVLAKVPDVAKLTAAQLQEQLDEFEDRTAQTASASASFERARAERAKTITEQQREAEVESERALDRAAANAASSTPRSNYSPQRRFPVYPQRGGFGYPVLYGGYRW